MAMAKPVVVSRVGAIRDGYGLQDGVNCKLVDPCDALGLRRAVTSLLEDDVAAAEIGRRARSLVVQRHTWERYVRDLMRILAGAALPGIARHGRGSRGAL
jgi:glycosyltransferase involved in cell wall biosynthesis